MSTQTWHADRQLLEAYVRGALDAVGGASLEQHLPRCATAGRRSGPWSTSTRSTAPGAASTMQCRALRSRCRSASPDASVSASRPRCCWPPPRPRGSHGAPARWSPWPSPRSQSAWPVRTRSCRSCWSPRWCRCCWPLRASWDLATPLLRWQSFADLTTGPAAVVARRRNRGRCLRGRPASRVGALADCWMALWSPTARLAPPGGMEVAADETPCLADPVATGRQERGEPAAVGEAADRLRRLARHHLATARRSERPRLIVRGRASSVRSGP